MNQGNDNSPPSGSADMASNMPNIPKVECGELATIQIEIYGPRDGHAHGSLDGVLRMCAKHDADLTEVIGWDASEPVPTIYRSAIAQPSARCGSGFDFVAWRSIPPFTPETEHAEVIAAYEAGREIGEKSVEAYREMVDVNLREALERIDGKMTELRELKARHAFTPSRIEGTVDDWLWQCACGEQFIQLEGERIHATLTAHAKGGSDDDAR